MNSSISSQWIMLDVMLHLAFITYVNLGEKVDEKKWVLLMQGLIIVFQVGLALLKYCEDDLVCFLTLI
jgi:hypothetical protein